MPGAASITLAGFAVWVVLQSSAGLRYARLPNTSPAQAVGIGYKLAAWRAAVARQ